MSLSPTSRDPSTPSIQHPQQEESAGWKLLKTGSWLVGKTTEAAGNLTQWMGSTTENLGNRFVTNESSPEEESAGITSSITSGVSSAIGNTFKYGGKVLKYTGNLTQNAGHWIDPYHKEESSDTEHGPLTREEAHKEAELKRIEERTPAQKAKDTSLWLLEKGLQSSSYTGRKIADTSQYLGNQLDSVSRFSEKETSGKFKTTAKVIGKVAAVSLKSAALLANGSSAVGEWTTKEVQQVRGDLLVPLLKEGESPPLSLVQRAKNKVTNTLTPLKKAVSSQIQKTITTAANALKPVEKAVQTLLEKGKAQLPKPPTEEEIEATELEKIAAQLAYKDKQITEFKKLRKSVPPETLKFCRKFTQKLLPYLKNGECCVDGLSQKHTIQASLLKLLTHSSSHLNDSTNQEFSENFSELIATELTLFFNHYRRALSARNGLGNIDPQYSQRVMKQALGEISHPVTHEGKDKVHYLQQLAKKIILSSFPKEERGGPYAEIAEKFAPLLLNASLKNLSNKWEVMGILGDAFNLQDPTIENVPVSFQRLGSSIYRAFSPNDTDPTNVSSIGQSIGASLYQYMQNITPESFLLKSIQKQHTPKTSRDKQRIEERLTEGLKNKIFGNDLPKSKFMSFIYWVTHPRKWLTLWRINGKWCLPSNSNRMSASRKIKDRLALEIKSPSFDLLRYRLLGMFGLQFNKPWEEQAITHPPS